MANPRTLALLDLALIEKECELLSKTKAGRPENLHKMLPLTPLSPFFKTSNNSPINIPVNTLMPSASLPLLTFFVPQPSKPAESVVIRRGPHREAKAKASEVLRQYASNNDADESEKKGNKRKRKKIAFVTQEEMNQKTNKKLRR